jgi:hypothetical protein
MTRLQRVYRDFSLVLSGGLVLLGVAIAVRTWELGGGGVTGYVLAALFVLAGVGRIYLLRR